MPGTGSAALYDVSEIKSPQGACHLVLPNPYLPSLPNSALLCLSPRALFPAAGVFTRMTDGFFYVGISCRPPGCLDHSSQIADYSQALRADRLESTGCYITVYPDAKVPHKPTSLRPRLAGWWHCCAFWQRAWTDLAMYHNMPHPLIAPDPPTLGPNLGDGIFN